MKRPAAKKFDPQKIRRDFPILKTKLKGKPLIYFDNAATSQKPKTVIEAVNKYYTAQNANIHRGVYSLAEQVNELYETTRSEVASFFNAKSPTEIIFTRNATEAINLVAESFARDLINDGDEIIVSIMEHHSNFLPWQRIAKEKNAHLKIIPINQRGEIEFENVRRLISKKTKIIALAHASNVLGTINPIEKIIALAKEQNTPVLIDGAQATPHFKIDLQKLNADFYVFSAHKMYGPHRRGRFIRQRKKFKKDEALSSWWRHDSKGKH
jgi:cysteine desulfurase / selenocysteine lyase